MLYESDSDSEIESGLESEASEDGMDMDISDTLFWTGLEVMKEVCLFSGNGSRGQYVRCSRSNDWFVSATSSPDHESLLMSSLSDLLDSLRISCDTFDWLVALLADSVFISKGRNPQRYVKYHYDKLGSDS